MTLGEMSHDGGLSKTVNGNVTGFGVNYAALKNHLVSAIGHLACHQANSGGVSPGYDFFAFPVTCQHRRSTLLLTRLLAASLLML